MSIYDDFYAYELDPFGRETRREYAYPATFNPDAVLELNPHYSDDRFKKEQTVFGRERKGLFYNYSDRLWQGDPDLSERSAKAATASGVPLNTARWLTAYLSAYHSRPIELHHVIAGVNRSNGYSYCVYGYIFLDKERGKP